MVVTFEGAPVFKPAIAIAKLEYQVILGNLKAYQKLYRYKFLDGECNLNRLSELIGCSINEVVDLERNLDAYFKRVMNGNVRSNLVDLVCPSCFQLSLTDFAKDGEEIKKCCRECGEEFEDSFSEDTFDQNLDRDVTYAPTSHISWTKGLGGTFNVQKDLIKILSNNCVCKLEHFENQAVLAQFEPEVNDSFLVKLDASAKALLPDVEIVVSGDKAFRKMGDEIHWIPLAKLYCAVDEAFHSNDLYLRRKKTILESGVRSNLKNALEYGLALCARYGFDNKNQDQAFFNTVGREITLMKHQLKAQRRHIPEKQLVETMVYICALLFDKKGIATRMKSELDIDVSLVDYYDDYKEFLQKHDKPDSPPVLLKALEQASQGMQTN